MNKMQKYVINIYRFSMFLIVCIMCMLVRTPVFADTQLTPYTLKNGENNEIAKYAEYEFTSDGKEVIPLTIKKNGYIVMNVRVSNAQTVNIEVHNRADASDIPTYFTALCTSSNDKKGIIEQYIKKGTYYLVFPQNEYKLNLQLYSNDTQTVKHGSTIVQYCDYFNPTMVTFKAAKTGYITLTQNWIRGNGSVNEVTLCNSKGTPITESVTDHTVEQPVSFPVKKGNTYKVKFSMVGIDQQQFYQLNLDFTAREQKKSTSKSKATSVSFSKTFYDLAFAEDKENTAHWYKFSLTKPQKVQLICNGQITAGGMEIALYDSKGKIMSTYNQMPSRNTSIKFDLQTKKGSTNLPKGKYYIKVTKLHKKTVGIYGLTLKKKKAD